MGIVGFFLLDIYQNKCIKNIHGHFTEMAVTKRNPYGMSLCLSQCQVEPSRTRMDVSNGLSVHKVKYTATCRLDQGVSHRFMVPYKVVATYNWATVAALHLVMLCYQ